MADHKIPLTPPGPEAPVLHTTTQRASSPFYMQRGGAGVAGRVGGVSVGSERTVYVSPAPHRTTRQYLASSRPYTYILNRVESCSRFTYSKTLHFHTVGYAAGGHRLS